MSGRGQKLLEEALTLPPDERADLAARVLDDPSASLTHSANEALEMTASCPKY